MLQGKCDICEELQRVSRGCTSESCETLGISASFSELQRLCKMGVNSTSRSLGQDGRRPCVRDAQHGGWLEVRVPHREGSWSSHADESGSGDVDNEDSTARKGQMKVRLGIGREAEDALTSPSPTSPIPIAAGH